MSIVCVIVFHLCTQAKERERALWGGAYEDQDWE